MGQYVIATVKKPVCSYESMPDWWDKISNICHTCKTLITNMQNQLWLPTCCQGRSRQRSSELQCPRPETRFLFVERRLEMCLSIFMPSCSTKLVQYTDLYVNAPQLHTVYKSLCQFIMESTRIKSINCTFPDCMTLNRA